MERVFAIAAIAFGVSGLAILALAWLVQQRKPRPKAGKPLKEKAGLPAVREKPKDEAVKTGEKPAAAAVNLSTDSTLTGKEEETGEALLEEKKEVPGENLRDVREPAIERPPFTGTDNHWYIRVFPARALIEELSLLNRMREILHATGEIHEAIRAVQPGFNQEGKIAEFIYENNLQYYEMVSRGGGLTAYIREGRQCFADNDRCIYYKGYVWLHPDWVDFKLSPRKSMGPKTLP